MSGHASIPIGVRPREGAARVGINLLYLLPGISGGTETYALGLLEGLARYDHDNEYVIFLNAESSGLPLPRTRRFSVVHTGVVASSRPRRYLWEQTMLPRRGRAAGLDLLHSLGYVGPVAAGCPHVLTVPDINFAGHVGSMSWKRRAFLRFAVTRAARSASRLITISEYSKREIEHHLDIPASRIDVTHLASRQATVTGEEIAAVHAAYVADGPYLAAFCSQSPHKNIHRLVDAFASIADRVPHSLVLIGRTPAGGDLERHIAAAGLGERVVMTGFVPDEHVLPLVGGAELLAVPSLYEGFGLPVLDAQVIGTPVACSTAGSLPEVAGAGAAMFDPYSVSDMAETLIRCLTDDGQRRRLIQAGTRNADRFGWERTAEQTVGVYRQVLAGVAR